MNKTYGSGRCDLKLKNGELCGIPAIGRCATCSRAFCPTHQAREQNDLGWVTRSYVDQCTSCFAKTPMGVARAREAKEVAELRAAQEYFMSGSARAALLTSGVQPVEIYSVERRWESKRRGILRRYSNEEVEDATPFIHQYGGTRTEVQHAWIFGEFIWQYYIGYQPDARKTVTEQCLTALLDLSPAFPGGHVYNPLIRVRPWSRGYECLYSTMFFGWIEAAQAVKRLTGESS